MKPLRFFEKSVTYYQSTRRQSLEAPNPQLRLCKNLTSHNETVVSVRVSEPNTATADSVVCADGMYVRIVPFAVMLFSINCITYTSLTSSYVPCEPKEATAIS